MTPCDVAKSVNHDAARNVFDVGQHEGLATDECMDTMCTNTLYVTVSGTHYMMNPVIIRVGQLHELGLGHKVHVHKIQSALTRSALTRSALTKLRGSAPPLAHVRSTS